MSQLGERDVRQSASPSVAAPRAVGSAWLVSLAVVVGFGLFRGVSSNSYLSAFASVQAPFLFVPDLFFIVVAACSAIICSVVLIVLTLRGRLARFSMPIVLPAILLSGANLGVLSGAFSMLPSDMALIVPAILSGVASIMLSLVWIEVFACETPKMVVTHIALGMLASVITSSILSTLLPEAQMVVSCVLLGAMALCGRYVRGALKQRGGIGKFGTLESDEAVGSAESIQVVENPKPEPSIAPAKRSRGSYRDAFLELGDSLVAFCVLEAVIGLLNSFMLAGSISFEGSGTVSVSGMLIGIVAFCVTVFVAQRTPRVSTAFRALMPIIASLLVFLPFLGEQYNLFFSTVLLGSYYFVAVLITYTVARIAREHGVSPYVLMGATAGLARVFLAVALVGGFSIGSIEGGGLFGQGDHTMRFLVIIVAVIYALSLSAVFISRDRRRKRREGEGVDVKVAAASVEAGASERPSFDDGINECSARLAEEGGLTERETEILGYLLRGRTKAHIAGTLFVSENTVRSHVRNIYAKLDVHTRQELIDLMENEDR